MKLMVLKQEKSKKKTIIDRMKKYYRGKTRDIMPYGMNEYMAQEQYKNRIQ